MSAAKGSPFESSPSAESINMNLNNFARAGGGGGGAPFFSADKSGLGGSSRRNPNPTIM